MSFAKWRYFIPARGSDCGYPRAVLSLEQGLTILSLLSSVLSFIGTSNSHTLFVSGSYSLSMI